MLLANSISGPEVRLYELDMKTREFYPLEGIPYLSFGIRLLHWGNVAPMPTDASPVTSGVGLSVELLPRNVTPSANDRLYLQETTVGTLDSVNIRSGPSIQSPVIGRIDAGKPLVAVGLSVGQDWLMVRSSRSDTGFAWVFAALTDYDHRASRVPTVDAPP